MKPSQRYSGRAETRAQIPRLSEGPWLCLSAPPWASDYSSAPITGTGGPWAASHLLPFYLQPSHELDPQGHSVGPASQELGWVGSQGPMSQEASWPESGNTRGTSVGVFVSLTMDRAQPCPQSWHWSLGLSPGAPPESLMVHFLLAKIRAFPAPIMRS